MSFNNNVFAIFQQRFPEDGSKPFLIDHHHNTLSYSEMEKLSAKLANYFIGLGLAKGDRLAVQVRKSPQALLVYLAAVRAGLIYLPLNTAYTSSELGYFFSDAAPALVICDPADYDTISALIENTVKLETLDSRGNGSLISSAADCPERFSTVICEADDLAAILYTSGTTGRPKGAMLSHGNLSSNALMLQQYWGWKETDVLLHVLPIFHVHGLFVACHCVLAAGASMIFLPAFDTEQVKKYLPQATVMMGVPTFYTRLLDDESFNVEHCSSMRLFISGSAPLLAETHLKFEQRSGQRILERYGMSETGMLVSNPLQGERRAGTVGLPLPGVELRIVDEHTHAVAVGEVGSIQVKGANVFQGYWNMPGKTARDFTQDGFFITGDQGQISGDGYIAIVGRAKDMVISGGYNVYPKEVELVLDAIDGIKESAVFGIVDKDFGEVVTAAVVLDKSRQLQVEQLIEQAKQHLASYKIPKQIYFVDQLPRNTMGKVQKNSLRQQFDPG